MLGLGLGLGLAVVLGTLQRGYKSQIQIRRCADTDTLAIINMETLATTISSQKKTKLISRQIDVAKFNLPCPCKGQTHTLYGANI